MNKIIFTIFVALICSSIQTTKSHKDEIKIKIVHSNTFDSFVSNFGQNFNSFVVKLLQDSNFDNEPFYIKNLAFILENTNLVVARTNYVNKLVTTHTKNILEKYFSEVDLDVCESVFTKDVMDKINHIVMNTIYIENMMCSNSKFCFIEKLLQIANSIKVEMVNRTSFDNYFALNHKTLFESGNFKNIVSLFVNEYIKQYIDFMKNPTYSQFTHAIDQFFTNIDDKLDSQKSTVKPLILSLNRINKNACVYFFDVNVLTSIDEYIDEHVRKFTTI